MANAIAVFLGNMIPASAAGLIPLITALLGIPGLIFLGGNSYYFGILPVLASLAANYGISHVTMGNHGRCSYDSALYVLRHTSHCLALRTM